MAPGSHQAACRLVRATCFWRAHHQGFERDHGPLAKEADKLWEPCGPWVEKPTPHRFRHTFARILQQRTNVTVRDVAELLGNTEQMVLKHYSAWVSSRQERLTSILKSRKPSTTNPSPRWCQSDARRELADNPANGADWIAAPMPIS